MSLSAKEIEIATGSLGESIVNTLVRKVISPAAKNRICLELRGPGLNHYLQICVENPYCAIGRVDAKPRAAEVPAAFVMLLRKLCINAAVLKIEQLNHDRVVAITLGRKDYSLVLMCELSGRHGNLFLLDEQGNILGSFHPNRSHLRKLVSGAPYQPPVNPPPMSGQKTRVMPGSDADRALMTLMAESEKNAAADGKRAMVARAVKAVLKKQRTLVANLQKDQQNAEKAAQLKHNAYILQGNLRHIHKGDTQFCGMDFEGSPVVIALNPQLDGVANMQAMFEKASRLGKAIDQIEERLLAAMMREEHLVELQQQVTVVALETLDELMGQLSQMNVQVVQRVGKRGQTVRLPYRQYPVFGTHIARVGRSARDNDALTLKHAGPNDLWLHVRGLPGSHVVVPLGRGEEPGQELLLDAAHLAAHFSSARNDDHVEVTWTLRKYVQKPRGAAPGAVRLLKEKTFILRVDPHRLEELLSAQK